MMEVEDSRTIILASVLSVVAVALLYLYCCGRKRRCGTEYFYQKTVFNTRAVERLRTSVGDYQPPWWFHPGWAALEYRRDLKVAFVRELVSYSDGTTFAVDWFPNAPAAAQRSAEKVIKICLYFPGLGGNSTKVFVPCTLLSLSLSLTLGRNESNAFSPIHPFLRSRYACRRLCKTLLASSLLVVTFAA